MKLAAWLACGLPGPPEPVFDPCAGPVRPGDVTLASSESLPSAACAYTSIMMAVLIVLAVGKRVSAPAWISSPVIRFFA